MKQSVSWGFQSLLWFVIMLTEVSGASDYEIFWAELPRLEHIRAEELARARAFLGYTGNTAYSHSGTIDLSRRGALYPPKIDVRDRNLMTAIIEGTENNTEDYLQFDINAFVARHIERLQTNSIYLARWKHDTESESTEYKLHSFGCWLYVAWLRWSEAWNLDYRTGECVRMATRNVGTEEQNAPVQDMDPSGGDSDGFVNAEFGCIQSRTLNNFEPAQELQSPTSDLRITRYNIGGNNPLFVDLESFYETIRTWRVRSQEVRFTSFYTNTSTPWQFYHHLSFPTGGEAEFNSSLVAEARMLSSADCAKQLIRDRSRVRTKAVEVSVAKGQEVLIDEHRQVRQQTDLATVVLAAAASIIAAVSTTSRIGNCVLQKLEECNPGQYMNIRLSLSLEFASILIFSIPLHLALSNEIIRQLENTVQSVVFITTTEYEPALGLTDMTAGEDSDPYHLVNMVQVERKANTRILALAISLEILLLAFSLIFVFGYRRTTMKFIQKSQKQIEVI